LVSVDDGTVTCLSEGGDGDSPIGQGERIAISHDGSWVAFTTRATNLGVPQNDVVLVSTRTGARIAGSAQTTGSVTVPSISTTGAYLAFGSSVPLDVRFASSGMFVRFTEDARAFFWSP
jgi:Tol biopolymer transport system component